MKSGVTLYGRHTAFNIRCCEYKNILKKSIIAREQPNQNEVYSQTLSNIYALCDIGLIFVDFVSSSSAIKIFKKWFYKIQIL